MVDHPSSCCLRVGAVFVGGVGRMLVWLGVGGVEGVVVGY